MIIIVCDGGCGAQSPDPIAKNGRHVANHWATVRVAGPGSDINRKHQDDDLRFCPKCWPRIGRALTTKEAGTP